MSRLLIWLCVLLWLALAAYGVIAWMQLEPTDSGFTRGSNRIAAFFKWQALALIPAFIAYVIGRSSGAEGTRRLASRLPLWISGGFFALTVLAFVAALIFARLG